jgi:thiol:disulfide interchange protein
VRNSSAISFPAKPRLALWSFATDIGAIQVRQFAFGLLAIPMILFALCPARAQGQNPIGFDPQSPFGIVGQFDPASSGEAAMITTRVAPATADQPATLLITAQIAPGKHAYSLTQPKGGPRPTQIELVHSSDYRLLAAFRSQPAPESRIEKGPVWTGLKIEEHKGTVTWYAPIEITAGVDPKKLEIKGSIRVEVCEDGGACELVEKEFAARVAAGADNVRIADWPLASAIGHAQSTVASFQMKGSAVKLSGRLVPASVRPGESAELRITATTPPGGHIYAYTDRDPLKGTKPVLIALQSTGGLLPERPATDAQTKIDNSEPSFGPLKYHEGDVTWTQRIEVPKDAPAGEYPIVGLFGYQMCDYSGGEGVCELPQAVRFATKLTIGPERSQTDAPLTFAPGDGYSRVAAASAVLADFYTRHSPQVPASPTPAPPIAQNDLASASGAATSTYDLTRVSLETSAAAGSLAYYIAVAFVGGLILNLMPCVLPVIGLKVMSFVEQSGKSRSHALVLNIWFAAGIIAVFLLLGLLAATIGLSWGGQFGKTSFNVTIAAVVFAMALSLLGVWEVPIPGFFGSGSVQSAAAKEGPLGAFLKGVVTTVLATPCTAPLMAAAIAWAVTQPVATNLTVFAMVGLGMASPYLLVGVYPELLRFLPKPGQWMDTFKQISGFVLLGTVVFILSFIEPAAVVPTILLLLGIAVACWLVARTPLTAELGARMRAWASAAVVILLFVAVAFGGMYRLATAPVDQAWQQFSLERLQQVAVDEGKTVLVDFSAEWCFNCKLFEKSVLHTKPVEQAIAQSGAVTMYADFTDYPPEIDRTIKALGANGVPVIAIFPGGSPHNPIVFRGGYTKQNLITALAEAKSRRAGTQVVSDSQPRGFTPAVVR